MKLNIDPNIAANYCAALFLVVILFGLYFNNGKKASRSLVFFRICIWLCLAGLLCDGTIHVLLGSSTLSHLAPFFVYFAYVLTNALVIAFALYYQSLAQMDGQRTSKIIMAEIFLSSFDFVLFTVGSLTGKLIYTNESYEVSGPWYPVTVTLRIFCIVILFIYIMKVRKTIGSFYTIVLSSLFLFYVVVCILGFIIPIFKSNYVATAFAAVMSYVFIQSRTISEVNIKAETYNSLSVLDFLTGLKNRRGFQEAVDALDPDAEVGVLFCDINGLKRMNDNYGHESGDRLIRRMADLLREQFPEDESFRISGDEFVSIIRLNEGIDFESRSKHFMKVLAENDHIASLGNSKGRASGLMELMRQAEAGMYEEKRLYYEELGLKASL